MKLYHLFPDLMNLYGDYGNLMVLKQALEDAGEPAEIVAVHPGGEADFSDADLLYMGPGTEPARNHALTHLRPYLDSLRDALLTRRVPALFTGNSWSLLGQAITLANGEILDGLSIFHYVTAETRDRYTGDAIALPASETILFQGNVPENQCKIPASQNKTPGNQDDPLPTLTKTAPQQGPSMPSQAVVGYLNRCDKVEGVQTPLFSLHMGKGNDGISNLEGFYQENCFFTHLTGPLLVKNPHLLRFFVSLLGVTPKPLDETTHPALAYQVTLQALQDRLAN